MEIGWIDYLKEERDKIIEIFDLLGAQETLDELGIGRIRDEFSDLLFPGISVLQRRAKYFVLLPYMFSDALHETQADRLHSGKEVRDYIEKCENKIVYTLKNNSKGDAPGIVGSRNYVVDTKPSAMYWNGMKVLGILTEPSFSIQNACNAIYGKGRLHSKTERKNETEEEGPDDSDVNNDNIVIFNSISAKASYKKSYMKEASIELTKEEAEFLYGRILHADGTKNTALSYLLKRPELLTKYVHFEDFRYQDFSGDLAEIVRLAHEFSEFIYGAHLLYNIIYADGCGTGDKVTNIKHDFSLYKERYTSPDIKNIIRLSKPDYKTIEFIQDFDNAMSAGNIERAKEVIVLREEKVKLKRSKLLRPSDYQFKDPIHYFKLSYRYERARDILMDIVNGIGNNHE